jgi:hypothetical protein
VSRIADVTIEEIAELHNKELERGAEYAQEHGIDLETVEGRLRLVDELGERLNIEVLKRFILMSPPLTMAVAEGDVLTVGAAFFRAGFLSGRNSVEVKTDA